MKNRIILCLAYLFVSSYICYSQLNLNYEAEQIRKYEETVKEISMFKDSARINEKLSAFEQIASQTKLDVDYLLLHLLKGDEYSFKSKYFNSNFHYFEALKYAQKSKPSYFLSKIYHGLAINHRQENKNNDAIEYYRKSIKEGKKSKYKIQFSSIYNDLGIAFFENKQLDSSVLYYKKALVHYKLEDNALGEGIYNSNIGDVFFEKQKYEDALMSYKAALKDFEGISHIGIDAQLFYNMARTFLQINKFDEALAYGLKANKNGKITKNLKLIYDSEFLLSHIYSKLKKYEKSNFHLSNSLEIQKDINKQDVSNKIQAAKYGYDFELQKIINGNQAADISQKRKENLILFVALGLIGLSLIMTLYFFNQNRKKSKIIQEINEDISALNKNLEVTVNVRTTELREANKELIKKNFEITEALYKGQTIERKRVAAELHDNLGSTLSALKWRLEALDGDGLSEKEKAIYASIKVNMKNAYEEVRSISHNLMPKDLEEKGLVSAIETLLNDLKNAGKLNIHFNYNEFNETLAVKTAFEIYNILLELINNSLKYSQAENLWVTIRENNDILEITVHDDGIGLKNRKAGVGTNNISQRVSGLNGNIDWDLENENGARISLDIPLVSKTLQ